MRDMSMDVQDHILIIKLGALGDFIQALGPMKAIRAHHKNAHITLLTTPPFAEIAKQSGYVDDVILDTRPKCYKPRAWLDLREKLKVPSFTRVYDLQNNDRTALYFKLMGKPEWVGIAKGAKFRNTSKERTAGLAFDGHVQTLKLAGISGIDIDKLDWVRDYSNAFKQTSAFENIIKLQRPYALLVPGASANHPEKMWGAENYAGLACELTDLGYTPLIIGSASERDLAAHIKNICKDAIDLTGTTNLLDIALLAKNAACAVGNDTGPMHIIGVTGCPALVLFSGASNPARHRPLGEKVSTIKLEKLSDLGVDEVMRALEMRGFRMQGQR